jgi:hypothetical protein
MKQNKDTEIYLGGGNNIEMKSSRMVTAYQVLYLTTPTDGTITLNVKIEADFDTVPEEYHEVFMNMMSVKYLNRVSFGDNPFSQCLPAPKHKWYQFWKKLEYKTKSI